MWDSQTCLVFLERFVARLLAIRRKELGLTVADRAMIICDAAPVHQKDAFLVLRNNFCKQHNCYIFGSDAHAETKVPKGIGAVAAPNDGWHQFLHAARKICDRYHVGHTSTLLQREAESRFVLNAQGKTQRSIDYPGAASLFKASR